MAKELNNFILSAIAIIGLTVIVLVGISISNAFSKELRAETTFNSSANTLITLDVIGVSVLVGTSGQYPFLQSLTGCQNATNSTLDALLPESAYTIDEGTSNGGRITLTSTGGFWNNTALNCSAVTYLSNSAGQSAADKFSTGLGAFGTFAVIIILAIVGKAIISLFRKKD